MSDPISKVKNSSGTLDAYIASSDVADSFEGYASFSRKMNTVSAGSYRRLDVADVPMVVRQGVLPVDSGGTLELREVTDVYFTVEYDVSAYKNYFLVFHGEHHFNHQAFVVTDASGKVLAKDSCTDDSGVTPVLEEVAVGSTAAKAYCGFEFLGVTPAEAEGILENVADVYVNNYNDAVDAGDGIFYNYVEPDGFIYNHFITTGYKVDVSVLRSLRQSYSHCIAYKRVKRGQRYRASKLIGFGSACGAATVDEDMTLRNVLVIPTDADTVTRSSTWISIDADGWLLWNYTGPDVMCAPSLGVGVPPFSSQYVPYTDFTVRIDRRTDVVWDDTREGYYGFFQSEDQFKPYEGIRVSDPLAISGSTMWIKGTWWAECPLAVMFDADGNKIMQIPQARLDNDSGYVDTPVYVPAEASTMVLQDVSGATGSPADAEPPELYWYYGVQPFKKDDQVTTSGENVLAGKKYVACGDSFTDASNLGPGHYDAELDCYESYAYMIAKRNGMVYAPDAISGSTITVTESEWERYPFSRDRYKNIPEDADYITLMFGLNETSAPLGTEGSTDNTTVWGAWDVVLEWILTNRPRARVGIIISDAWMTQAYAQTLIDIANYWGVPYLDLGGDPKVPLMNGGRRAGSGVTCSEKAAELRNRQHYQTYPSDSHPNYEGHVWRSTVIENWMRGL